MKEEGRANPSLYDIQKGNNKNLCISGGKQEMTAISNEEELVYDLWALGRIEDEIASILNINIQTVHEYLLNGGYIDD